MQGKTGPTGAPGLQGENGIVGAKGYQGTHGQFGKDVSKRPGVLEERHQKREKGFSSRYSDHKNRAFTTISNALKDAKY